jgi:hypothetical protein
MIMLSLNELVLNQRYADGDSGIPIRICSIGSNKLNRTLQVRGRYYNKLTGLFTIVDIYDGQLVPFDVYPPSLATINQIASA